MTNLEETIRELYFWQYSNTGCFNNMLFDLYLKADVNNQACLEKGYPFIGEAIRMWQTSGDGGKNLFKTWGLIK